jgi:RNA chaperone Hfq
METNLLDRMLNTYLAAQTPVTVTLQNKIRMSGKIKAFDSYVIVLEGQKREIVYRHAVSCLAPHTPDEQKRSVPASRPAQAKPAAKPSKPPMQTSRQQPQAALSASAGETSINNSMKEGLLRWMQEQKAAK